jgi:Domain of unknown function (DUF6458)
MSNATPTEDDECEGDDPEDDEDCPEHGPRLPVARRSHTFGLPRGDSGQEGGTTPSHHAGALQEAPLMGIGTSIFLLAVGAILTFAIETDSTEGINVNTIGIILMIAGAIGIVLFALVFGRRSRVVEGGTTTVVDRRL